MSNRWQLQQAKAKLSEVVELAQRLGPQHITKNGKEAAVVLSAEEYRRLAGGGPSVWEMLRHPAARGFRIERIKSRVRPPVTFD